MKICPEDGFTNGVLQGGEDVNFVVREGGGTGREPKVPSSQRRTEE